MSGKDAADDANCATPGDLSNHQLENNHLLRTKPNRTDPNLAEVHNYSICGNKNGYRNSNESGSESGDESDEDNLSFFLKTFGKREVPVKSDGNCLLRAVSLQLGDFSNRQLESNHLLRTGPNRTDPNFDEFHNYSMLGNRGDYRNSNESGSESDDESDTESGDENDEDNLSDILEEFGREAVSVEDDGNCLLRGVSLQLDHPSIHDHVYLRQQICLRAKAQSTYYSNYAKIDEETFLRLVELCQQVGEWECITDHFKVVIKILEDVIHRKIVVLCRNDHYFTREKITGETVVVVQKDVSFIGTKLRQ